MIKDHNDTDMATYSVAIMLGLSMFVLGPLLTVFIGIVPWGKPICFAYFSSMTCLLALWLAIGNSPFSAQLSIAILPGTALGLLTLRHDSVALFPLLASIVPLLALPSSGLRSLGYQLVRIRAKSASEMPLNERPIQFSLRHLFGLSAAVAIYAFVGSKLLADNDTLNEVAVAALVLFGVLSVSASAAAWAALSLTKPGIRLLLAAAVTGGVAMVLATAYVGESEQILQAGGWLALHTLMVGGELLLFREVGYRLVRVRVPQIGRGQSVE